MAFDLATLDDESSTIYLVGADLRIEYVNRAWSRFAKSNGAIGTARWGVGTELLDVIPEVLKAFYVELFGRAIRDQQVVEHDYECSSPDVKRIFRMRLLPNDSGVIVINALRVEAPHPGSPHAPVEAMYRDKAGLITQCSHCRRVRRVGAAAAWDWVPAYVGQLPLGVSHGLCPTCVAFYYAEWRQ